MPDVLQQHFFSPTLGVLEFSGVIREIVREMRDYPGRKLRVSVGTDSEEIGDSIKFVALVHVWRVGKGARAYRTELTEPAADMSTRRGSARFRDRIFHEIVYTATLAQELRSALRAALGSTFLGDIEVHADVGANGGSSVMIREVLGMLKGYGFPDEVIKFKPDAYAASAVADHYI